jgi:N-acetylglutamate synthase-like GNAT family acetyltransferase
VSTARPPQLALAPVGADDVDDLVRFLRAADLTTAGLDAPDVRLWLDRDAGGRVVGSTGYELSPDGAHALVRSVAVDPAARRGGYGTALARYALAAAAAKGARRAWLFSRRSGAFWRTLGFVPADRDALAAALGATRQVRLFAATGRLAREVAWSRALP